LVWIPASDFTSANNYQITGTNKYNDFAPIGAASGAANFGDPTLEPGRGLNNNATSSQAALTGTENWYTSVYTRPNQGGGFTKTDYNYNPTNTLATTTFSGATNEVGGEIHTTVVGSAPNSGDGVLSNNSEYVAENSFQTGQVVDLPAGFISCQVIDNKYVNIQPLPGQPTLGGYFSSTYTGLGFNANDFNTYTGMVIEYGLGGLNGAGSQWNNPTEMRDATCNNSDSSGSTWYSDLSTVPGGVSAVTKVRYRFTRTFTAAEQFLSNTKYLSYYTRLKVLPTAPIGQIVPNYAKFYDPVGAWFTGWKNSTYDSQTGLGTLGDRITITGTRVRIQKTIKDLTAESETKNAGSENQWFLAPISDNLGNLTGQATNVKIVDTLPTGLNYKPNSSACLDITPAVQPVSCEPTVVININGTSTLIWDFGSFVAGSAITKISYSTISDSTILNNASLVNTTVISADNDNSVVSLRANTATAVFVNTAAFSVQKKVLSPEVGIGDPVTFKLIGKNTGNNQVTSSDFIDWLPWNGDARFPSSNFTGNLNFTSLTSVSGVPATSVEYTKYNRSSLALPADLDPSTVNSAIIWCTALSGGTCPANNSEITGFRVKTGTLNTGEGIEWNLVLTPDSANLDSTNDIITNRFKGRLGGLALPVESNNVFATVIGGSIGDTIYIDNNKNGILDTSETGMSGAKVELFDSVTGLIINCKVNAGSTNVPCSFTTDSTGKYLFSNLKFGNYKVKITPPAGYIQTGDPDSTTDNETVLKVDNTSTAARSNLTGDFGYYQKVNISGYVYVDTSNEGTKDTGEAGIKSTKLTLTGSNSSGVLITPIDAFADIDGKYEFLNLDPGTYTVTESQPTTPLLYLDGKDTTGTGATTAGTTSQDDKIASIILKSGESSINNNFGELPPPATITGSVYLNPNNNGTQDAGEPNPSVGSPLPAGTVVKIVEVGNPTNTYTATINADGTYSQVVTPGNYTVTVTAPSGYTVSTSTELDNGTGPNPTTLAVAAGETKSQGKDGLYLTPVVSSSSSVVSSSVISSSSLLSSSSIIASSSIITSSSIVQSSSSQVNSSSSLAASSSSLITSSSSFVASSNISSSSIISSSNVSSSSQPANSSSQIVANSGGTILIGNAPIVETKPQTNINSKSTQTSSIPVQIGVHKVTTGLTNNNDGTYSVGYDIEVANLGQKALENIYSYDYISESFYDTDYTIENLTSDKFTVSNTFNGRSDVYITTTPSTIVDKSKLPDANVSDANATVKTNNKLAIGEKAHITFKIKFNPKGKTGPFTNSAGAVGYSKEGERTEDDPPVDINIDQSGDPDGSDIASFKIPKSASSMLGEENIKTTSTIRTGGNSTAILFIAIIIMGIMLASSTVCKKESEE
jgi:hypothetical protein